MERILFRKKGLLVQSEVWYSHSRDSYSKCHRKYSKLLLEYNAMHSSIDSDLERDGIEIGRSTVGKFKGLTVKIFDLFEHIHSEEDISKGRRSSNVNKNHAVIVDASHCPTSFKDFERVISAADRLLEHLNRINVDFGALLADCARLVQRALGDLSRLAQHLYSSFCDRRKLDAILIKESAVARFLSEGSKPCFRDIQHSARFDHIPGLDSDLGDLIRRSAESEPHDDFMSDEDYSLGFGDEDGYADSAYDGSSPLFPPSPLSPPPLAEDPLGGSAGRQLEEAAAVWGDDAGQAIPEWPEDYLLDASSQGPLLPRAAEESADAPPPKTEDAEANSQDCEFVQSFLASGSSQDAKPDGAAQQEMEGGEAPSGSALDCQIIDLTYSPPPSPKHAQQVIR